MPSAPPPGIRVAAGRRAAVAATTLVAAAGGPILVGTAPSAGDAAPAVLAVGIAGILGAIALQVVQIYRDHQRIRTLDDERAMLRRDLRDALKPIPELVSQLPSLGYRDRALRLQGIAQACATGLYMLLAPRVPEMRANVFVLEDSPDRMLWLAHVGRGDPPGAFVAGTPRGDAALDFITALEPTLYHDLSIAFPLGHEEEAAGYSTFVAVPIWSDRSVHGMITVDGPVSGSLTIGDRYLVEIVAELMATAFEVANTEPPPSAPAGTAAPGVQ